MEYSTIEISTRLNIVKETFEFLKKLFSVHSKSKITTRKLSDRLAEEVPKLRVSFENIRLLSEIILNREQHLENTEIDGDKSYEEYYKKDYKDIKETIYEDKESNKYEDNERNQNVGVQNVKGNNTKNNVKGNNVENNNNNNNINNNNINNNIDNNNINNNNINNNNIDNNVENNNVENNNISNNINNDVENNYKMKNTIKYTKSNKKRPTNPKLPFFVCEHLLQNGFYKTANLYQQKHKTSNNLKFYERLGEYLVNIEEKNYEPLFAFCKDNKVHLKNLKCLSGDEIDDVIRITKFVDICNEIRENENNHENNHKNNENKDGKIIDYENNNCEHNKNDKNNNKIVDNENKYKILDNENKYNSNKSNNNENNCENNKNDKNDNQNNIKDNEKNNKILDNEDNNKNNQNNNHKNIKDNKETDLVKEEDENSHIINLETKTNKNINNDITENTKTVLQSSPLLAHLLNHPSKKEDAIKYLTSNFTNKESSIKKYLIFLAHPSCIKHPYNLKKVFKNLYLEMHKQTLKSRLEMRVLYGILAYKTRTCYSEPARKSHECPTCLKMVNEFARCVPYSKKDNSFILCKGSGQEICDDNQGFVFDSGYVYCERYITTMEYTYLCKETGIVCKTNPKLCYFI